MRRKTLIVLWTQFILTMMAYGQVEDLGIQLDSRLQAALSDIRQRDPEFYKALREALHRHPEGAKREIAHHAAYLDEIALAKANNPRRFALMLEQEEKEKTVRELADRVNVLPPDHERRGALVETLRANLEDWFEIRQSLRSIHVDELAVRLTEQRTRLDHWTGDREAARDTWLRRVVAGGTDAMQHRLERLAQQDDVATLASVLLKLIVKQQPDAGRRLAKLAEENHDAFLVSLRRMTEERPELLDRARQTGAEDVELRGRLRSASRHAHQLLLTFARSAETVEIPENREAEVDQAWQAFFDAELAVTQSHLGRAQRRLTRLRDNLQYRRQYKEFIVDLRLAKLIGGAGRFEW